MLQSPTLKGATVTELDSESIYIHINRGHDLCSGDGVEMPCSFLRPHTSGSCYKINLFKHANTGDFTD